MHRFLQPFVGLITELQLLHYSHNSDFFFQWWSPLSYLWFSPLTVMKSFRYIWKTLFTVVIWQLPYSALLLFSLFLKVKALAETDFPYVVNSLPLYVALFFTISSRCSLNSSRDGYCRLRTFSRNVCKSIGRVMIL